MFRWLQRHFIRISVCVGKRPHFLLIPSLKSHGQALKQERCLPGLFCDTGDAPANLLCELDGHDIPCASCLSGKWVEDVSSSQLVVLDYFVLGCFLSCCTSLIIMNLINLLLLLSLLLIYTILRSAKNSKSVRSVW